MKVVILRGKWAGSEAEVVSIENGKAIVQIKDGEKTIRKTINVRHISPV